jgi:hypothetical protein
MLMMYSSWMKFYPNINQIFVFGTKDSVQAESNYVFLKNNLEM